MALNNLLRGFVNKGMQFGQGLGRNARQGFKSWIVPPPNKYEAKPFKPKLPMPRITPLPRIIKR
jgi:hypothetical protein